MRRGFDVSGSSASTTGLLYSGQGPTRWQYFLYDAGYYSIHTMIRNPKGLLYHSGSKLKKKTLGFENGV